eukprot:c10871_g1_i1.p1 GENE.c10871_g1_i1~~c10871_g1_i1.p1  ORF type:complete len:268 (+),score=63.46 c10871_g1_i1:57-806(+)
MGKRAVVVGSTGGVGRFLVKTLLLDPRITHVTAVVRKPQAGPATFFRLSEDEAKQANIDTRLRQVVMPDFEANFNESLFADHDLGFSCLGLYTAHAKSEAHFRQVEIEFNLKAAEAMKKGGVSRYAYLSGKGVKQDGSMLMFARVKGEAEKRLQAVGFASALAARPGGIFNRGEDTLKANVLEPYMAKMLPSCLGIDAEVIAQAMVHSTLLEDSKGLEKGIWENDQLKEEANRYTAGLTAARSEAGHSS